MQTEATVAEQESALAMAREQASEMRAARAQLERALAASTAEAAATIGALKASLEQHTAQALELEQQRCAHAQAMLEYLSPSDPITILQSNSSQTAPHLRPIQWHPWRPSIWHSRIHLST